MQDPMDQFLSALRGLEKVKTPLEEGTPQSTEGTRSSPDEETEEEELGKLRLARWKHQNKQLLSRR